MITDEHTHIRKLGLCRILKARSNPAAGVRKFKVSALKYDSPAYIDMIDWQSTDITEPPLLVDVSDSVIMELIESGESSMVDFLRFPCHKHTRD